MEMKTAIYLLLIVVNCTECQYENNQLLQLILRRFTPEQYYRGAEMLYQSLARANHRARHLNVLAKSKKIQSKIADDVPFPCDVSNGRSPERPISVHALRPGDIDVIGAMGDSLSAAFGALAIDPLNVAVANRGVSWAGGGQSTWREFLTLPNILKEFNPRLVGYSLGDSLSWQKKSQFNVAEGGAISSDMPHQSRILRKRMISDSRVNFEQDWKLVTYFIGGNDFCGNLCYHDESRFMREHERDLLEALDFLHDNFPRTLVNLVPAPNLELLANFTARPPECVISHTLECPCIRGSSFRHRLRRFVEIMDHWQKVDIEIANLPRYRDKEDFAIVVQPFSTGITFPTRKSPSGINVTDYSYLSGDCFHFSQKCGAITANALWNNMMEPVGQKALDWSPDLMARFRCPTEEHPFIFTHSNSQSSGRNRQQRNNPSSVNLQQRNNLNSVDLQQQNNSSSVDLQQQNNSSSVDLQQQNLVNLQQQNVLNSVNLQQQNIPSSVDLQQQNNSSSVDLQQQNIPSSVDFQQQNIPSSVDLQQQNIPSSVDLQQQNNPNSKQSVLQNQNNTSLPQVQNSL